MDGLTIGQRARVVMEQARQTLATTMNDHNSGKLHDAASNIERLMDFIYCYTFIDDPALETDDEILNWTLPDAADDYASALWSAACGFYKPAVSSIRNGYEMCAAALAFQIEENLNPRPGQYCSAMFAKWDRGNADTPNWGVIKDRLRKRPAFGAFTAEARVDVIESIYSHFQELCSFTHGRPYSKANGLPTNTTNIAADGFDEMMFGRVLAIFDEALSWSASMWLLAFPKIVHSSRQGWNDIDHDRLFLTAESRAVLDFVRTMPP